MTWLIAMNFRAIVILGAAIGLSGCSGAPDGYVESPFVKSYFSSLVAPSAIKADATLAACEILPEATVERVSVLFDDGMLYTYDSPRGQASFELVDQSSLAQRRSNRGRESSLGMGCMGRYTGLFSFELAGAYRLRFKDATLSAYVDSDFLVNNKFDEAEKARLTRIAKVMQTSAIEHAKGATIESTWGVEPEALQK